MRKSYFITPTRLVANAHLWKTIGMMKTVANTNVVCPRQTDYWIHNSWHLISPGNLCLVLEYSGRVKIRWDTNPDAAQKSMEFILENVSENYVLSTALESPHSPEKHITTFINTRLKEILEKEKAAHYANESTNCITSLVRNKRIRTYQLQRIWELIQEYRPGLVDTFISNVAIGKVPDAIIEQVLPSTLARPTSVYSYADIGWEKVVKEAYRRGMVVPVKPPGITVPWEDVPVTV